MYHKNKYLKKAIAWHMINNLLKTSDKTLKAVRRKKICCIQKNKNKDNGQFLVRNNASEKIVEQHL